MNKIKVGYLIIILAVFLSGAAIYYLATKDINPRTSTDNAARNSGNTNVSSSTRSSTDRSAGAGTIMEPIGDALSRVTLKPFGIHVSPKDSPVSPERFAGYHTGVDFETVASEQDTDVPVYAICAGSLALKKYGNGYGGFAVEGCQIGGQDVTVVYGHLRLSSISANIGQTLAAGEQIGVLGKGYSTETDGERKHLHLGIHKGKSIDSRGYVQTRSDLDGWIDVMTLLK